MFLKDGYTKTEVNIKWRNNKDSVYGVDKVHLPQFHIADYKTSTYIEETKTGLLVVHLMH
jgi:hypothetical protein